MSQQTAVISTSDRNSFRTCRRKWNWSSHLRRGLSPNEQALPLWMGTGIHFVMENLHGESKYQNVKDCLKDYYRATVKYYGEENLPIDALEQIDLATKMMNYYKDTWLGKAKRDPLETYKHEGIPQVEVPFEFELPISEKVLDKTKYSRIVYKGIIDRVIEDEFGNLFLCDYKSVSSFTDQKLLQLNSQINVYMWAASCLYNRPVIGFIYQEHKKAAPEPPKILKSGLMSLDKSQKTCAYLIRDYFKELYGNDYIEMISLKYREFLERYENLEQAEYNQYIRRTYVTRSPVAAISESQKTIAEVEEMLNDSIPIYPNPGQHCAWCAFHDPCVEREQGGNWNLLLQDGYYSREYADRSSWTSQLETSGVGKEVKKISLK